MEKEGARSKSAEGGQWTISDEETERRTAFAQAAVKKATISAASEVLRRRHDHVSRTARDALPLHLAAELAELLDVGLLVGDPAAAVCHLDDAGTRGEIFDRSTEARSSAE